jgi:hypothetical protein
VRVVLAEPVEVGEHRVDLLDPLIESALHQRCRQLGCEANEQQEFASEFVLAELVEQGIDERSPSRRGDRIDLLGGLAILVLDPANDQLFGFE